MALHDSLCDSTAFLYFCFCRAAGELQNEVKAHILDHVNVVTLYGMIFEPNHYGVVLEFLPHGCLDNFIYKYKVLFNLLCVNFS